MKYESDPFYWSGFLASAITSAIMLLEEEVEPADVAESLRRNLMAYLDSSPGQYVRQLLLDRMDGRDSTETPSNETYAAETSIQWNGPFTSLERAREPDRMRRATSSSPTAAGWSERRYFCRRRARSTP
jgi:hypothetical protein